ncbi:uncharacterized protein LOC122026511 [Zingiber officinale]|uniref:Uncharacterized protein n=1 Tax=Zingiber officinale TaxID=94328 RepID=A0A8J5CDH8_ZINOF|nr:uncharacterized protein LOC122026511 [Zingiber officinale]KAG6473636.1 hypothetical protein ZIOFF_067553 [Zingiber officinale]
MDCSGELKRHFEEADEAVSPEVKRLRADLLFDILDDDAGPTGEQDLEFVMKSLEEEIGLPAPAPLPVSQLSEERYEVVAQPDIGFLFEASDDELGLPPTDAPSSADERGVAAEEEVGVSVDAEVAGVGQIWGPDDAADGFGLWMQPEEPEEATVATEDAIALDGALFDYTDEVSGPYDISDQTWRTESLPAV